MSQSQTAEHAVLREAPRDAVSAPRRDETAKPVQAVAPERIRNVGGRLMV